jgi:two-component system chemotaxis sensor kinase CheA
VVAGNLEQNPIVDRAQDEVGTLARDFNTMLARIRELITEMNARAKREEARLEGLVAARTAELAHRNAAIRLLLDNTDQGFLALDLTGCLVGERSRAVDDYFGRMPEGASFAACIGALVPDFRDRFEPAWSQVVEDVLPLELTLEQLPRNVALDERHFDLGYRPLFDDQNRLHRVLVIVSDVTAEVQRKRAEQDELEVTRLYAKALEDRAGVAAFMQETQRLVGVIGRERELTRTQFKQAVHTLKGNAGSYGVGSLARDCHEIERAAAERRDTSPHVLSLRARWQQISKKLAPLAAEREDLRVDLEAHANLVQAIRDGAPRGDLLRMLEDWKVPSLDVQLGRLADQARSLAERLGKSPVAVSVEAGGLRLDPERFPGFWPAFTHAVRNAVDHGLEAPEERELLGKPATNRIWLRAFSRPGEICIEIEDSGRGIDWTRVRERARVHGLPSRTQSDLVEALFQDGLTTRDDVSEVSGRGVGLGALRETCIRFGGNVELWTVTGSGTRLRCTLGTNATETPRLSLAVGQS